MIGERILPHSVEAEICVVGSMLLDKKACAAARAVVAESDFTRPRHAKVFKAICWMADNPAKFGEPDLMTLKEALQRRGSLTAVMGVASETDAMQALVGLVDDVPAATNVEYYARIVRDKARLRSFIAASDAMVAEACDSPADVDAFLTRCDRDLHGLCRVAAGRAESAGDELRGRVDAIRAGLWRSIPWPWEALTGLAKPCLPESVTVLCGSPGSYKSFWLQEACLHWHAAGVPIAILHLEKSRLFNLMRAVAQWSGMGDFTDPDWIEHNTEIVEQIMSDHAELVDSFGARISDNSALPNGTLDDVLAWIRRRATEGSRIIVADPISLAAKGPRGWEDDTRFVDGCHRIADQHSCSIVLVTHPRSAEGKKPTMDDLAGGRAYSRATDCVLWLTAHESQETCCYGPCGNIPQEHNLTLSLFKTKSGKGQGLRIGMNIDKTTLRTVERGVLVKEK